MFSKSKKNQIKAHNGVRRKQKKSKYLGGNGLKEP
jgi:hypothetical protein